MNGLNLIINVFDSTDRPLFSKEEHYLLTYAAFHLMGTSSACINPFLYGFMNENFQVSAGKSYGEGILNLVIFEACGTKIVLVLS